MSGRWLHKLVEVELSLFGGKTTERTQTELDKMSAMGWELVAVAQIPADSIRLFFKKEG